MARVKTITVGCFELTMLEKGRWRFTNTLTSFVHISYGTEKEVREVAKAQSEAWKRRFSETGRRTGEGFRRKMSLQTERRKAEKKETDIDDAGV
jgi:hypothetical protein